MELEEFKERLKKGTICVHCDTEEKANELADLLNKDSYMWASGDALIDNMDWDRYGRFMEYSICSDDKKMRYGSICSLSSSYSIISLQEFIELYNKKDGEEKYVSDMFSYLEKGMI